jgi:hypothetical protein
MSGNSTIGKHTGTGVVQGDPRAHDAGCARPSVGLEDVAVQGHLLLDQDREIGDGPEATPDETLDLLGAA